MRPYPRPRLLVGQEADIRGAALDVGDHALCVRCGNECERDVQPPGEFAHQIGNRAGDVAGFWIHPCLNGIGAEKGGPQRAGRREVGALGRIEAGTPDDRCYEEKEALHAADYARPAGARA